MPHLLSQFSNNHEQIRILDKDGNTLGFSDYIVTGATVRLFDETYNTVVLDELALVIYGDVNGDSAVDAFDLFECDKALNGLTTLSGAYHEAADVNGDGVFNLNDYARLKAVTGGTAEIDQSIER